MFALFWHLFFIEKIQQYAIIITLNHENVTLSCLNKTDVLSKIIIKTKI